MRRITLFAAVLLLLAAAPPLRAQAAMPDDSLAYARQLTDWFYTSRLDSVHARFDDESRARMSVAELQEHLEQLVSRAGLESEVLEEKFVKRNGLTQYWRTANFTNFSEPLLFRWAFNRQGQIAGIGMGPASSPPAIDPD